MEFVANTLKTLTQCSTIIKEADKAQWIIRKKTENKQNRKPYYLMVEICVYSCLSWLSMPARQTSLEECKELELCRERAEANLCLTAQFCVSCALD